MTTPEYKPKSTPRNDVVEQCPRCNQLAWEAERIYGRPARYVADTVIDCPNCMSTLSVREGSAKGEAELPEWEAEESVSQAVREAIEEDKRRGNGKSHSGGGGRQAPKKHYKVERRYEQEPVFGPPPKQKITVSKANIRKEITLTTATRDRLQEWAEKASERTRRRVSMADGIRVAQKIYLEGLGDITEHEYASDKAELQMLFYQADLEALDKECDLAKRGLSRGAVLEACLLMWLPTVEEDEVTVPRPPAISPE